MHKYVHIYLLLLYVYVFHTYDIIKWMKGCETMAYTVSGYKASKKYKEGKIKRIPLDVQMSQYEAIKKYADEHGKSVNGFIKEVVFEKIKEST